MNIKILLEAILALEQYKTLLVKTGDIVAKGQVISKMGSTGRSTGPHVHYEVIKNGKQVDPLPYVYRKAD